MTKEARPRPPKSVIHHYIPEFLLNGWTGEDGRLERFTKPFGSKVEVRRVYPSQVGFERRLYDFVSYDEQRFAGLEHAYFRPIDDVAAKARRKLLHDIDGEWSSWLASGWSRFLLSLVHRNPDSIATFRSRLAQLLLKPSAKTQAHWETIRGADDPANYLDYLAQDSDYTDATALRLLPSVIDNENLGSFINKMTWSVMNFARTERSLLVSDYPLVISNGIKRPDGHLALALGPQHLFVACYKKDLLNVLMGQSDRETIFNYNKCVVERATRFIASSDRAQLRFIRNRFGVKPFSIVANVFDELDSQNADE